ncbi:TsaB protein, required for threonylcarbamoyladenosine (t(6)A) formation in tRNA / Ribosomal-protein-S18p-alanine acetyltransferase [plant metagenome]|uniref:TsaB protein, required for threonylcarbamoyladenosine (T(6)A) formation in tRNA / Ribosomal-protein-S18p-alanine acetyltransferase n=1 Tax=plant metagenome TaxID=1297885 RepID=A0A484VBZ5_9ZZZZ
MMLNLLALETSSSRCGVALLRLCKGEVQLTLREHEGSQEHAERLLPMADALLAEAGLRRADLGAVAFGQGPGGFTGLRVACGVTQGLAFALDLPVLPVVSHLAVASQSVAVPGQVVVVALDARMEEVYLAAYRRGAAEEAPWQTLVEPLLTPAAAVPDWLVAMFPAWGVDATSLPVRVAGDAWEAYAGQMALPALCERDPALRPGADAVARLGLAAWQRGETVPAEQAAPLYVRDKVAFTTAERAEGAGGNPRAQLPGPAAAAPVSTGSAALPAGMTLSPMTREDIDAVLAIETAVQAFPWTARNLQDALAAGYPAWVLREAGGAAAGFYIAMHAPDVAHLLVIAVRRDAQGGGLGRYLMAHCEAAAAALGLEGVLLEVRPSNAQAQRFYARQGFKQIGLRRGYYPAAHGGREDARVLQKPLAVVERQP